MYSHKLPVDSIKSEYMAALRESQVIIISGPTGTGKSTMIPLFTLEYISSQDSMSRVICTQTRRTATTLIAHQVKKIAPEISDVIGYIVRFDKNADDYSRLLFVTEGVLFNSAIQSLSDTPNFIDKEGNKSGVGVGALILDEIHERTLQMDILLSAILIVLKSRPTLRLVLMSATANLDFWLSIIPTAKIVFIPSARFHIDIKYLQETPNDDLSSIISVVLKSLCEILAQPTHQGNILIFVAGKREIDLLLREIQLKIKPPNCRLFPFHAGITPKEQLAAATPDGFRKIIIATNAAETSVTIPDTDVIIDTGLAREEDIDLETGLRSLVMKPVAKSSADQRAGRTGRTRNGSVFRLYSRPNYESRLPYPKPAILRSDLSMLSLQLHAYGFGEIQDLNLIQKPNTLAISRAHDVVESLGFVSRDASYKCMISGIGYTASLFRASPEYGRSLISALEKGVFRYVAAICSMLSVGNSGSNPIRFDRHKHVKKSEDPFFDDRGDHFMLLRIFCCVPDDIQERRNWCSANYLEYDAINMAIELFEHFNNVMLKIQEPDYSEASGLEIASAVRSSLMDGHKHKIGDFVDGSGFRLADSNIAVISKASVLYKRRNVNRILYDDVRVFDDESGRIIRLTNCTRLP